MKKDFWGKLKRKRRIKKRIKELEKAIDKYDKMGNTSVSFGDVEYTYECIKRTASMYEEIESLGVELGELNNE